MTAAASAQDAAGSTKPKIDDPRLDFVENAARFAAERKSDPAFRWLKAFLGADEDELALMLGKIYCDALPQRAGGLEALPVSALKLLLLPARLLATKKFSWRPVDRVDFDFEAIDEAHFEFWLKSVHDLVSGTKRVTKSAALAETAVLSTVLRLFAAPLWILPLWSLSRAAGVNFLESFRRTLGLFVSYEGHFRRFPSHRVVTCSDELNHPARWLAFHRNSGERLVAIQNGERIYHPAFAFGAVDDYLAFGPFVRRLCRDLKTRGTVVPVGAINFEKRLHRLRALARESAPISHDIVLIDQGLPPHNGLDARIGESFEKVFANLNELKKRRPELKIAFKLRPYPAGSAMKELVLAAVKKRFTEKIAILDEPGVDGTYECLYRARLALCFNSTIGYENFFVRPGARTLFVNCAGEPTQILCDDSRFQLYDPKGGYENFERAVLGALALELPEPPESARERHLPPDGLVARRIADHLKAL